MLFCVLLWWGFAEGKNGHVVHNTMVQNSIVASIVRPTAPGGKFRVQDGFEFDCEVCSLLAVGLQAVGVCSTTTVPVLELFSRVSQRARIQSCVSYC